MLRDGNSWVDPLDVAPSGDVPAVDDQIRALAREIALEGDLARLQQAVGELGLGPAEAA